MMLCETAGDKNDDTGHAMHMYREKIECDFKCIGNNNKIVLVLFIIYGYYITPDSSNRNNQEIVR